MKNPEYRIGNLTVVKVWELDLNDFAATQLLPEVKPEILAGDPAAMDARTYDRESGKVKLSVHGWLVRGNGKTILIDTGGGNDKIGRSSKCWIICARPTLPGSLPPGRGRKRSTMFC